MWKILEFFVLFYCVCICTPAWGGLHHGPAYGIPVQVPVPVHVPAPVAVPAPVVVEAVYSAPTAVEYAPPPPPPPTYFKYATAYAAPNPVVKYSLGAPITTTTTTYAGFAAPPSHFLTKFAAPPPSTYQYFSPQPPSSSYARYRIRSAPPPSAVYGAPPLPYLPVAASQAW